MGGSTLLYRYWSSYDPLKYQTDLVGVSAGTYAIDIYIYMNEWDSSTGYTIRVNYAETNKWETEYNDSIATADVIKTGQTIYGNGAIEGWAVDYGEDKDYFKWTADFTGRAFVSLTRPTNYMDSYSDKIYVSGINWNNQTIFSSYEVGYRDPIFNNNSTLFNVTQGKTYYFLLRQYDKNSSDARYGTYGLTVQRFRTNLKNTTITVTPSMVYTGSAVYPTVVVKRNGKTLKRNTDYTLTWSNNVGIGVGKVVITGKGNYYGSISKTFTIKPKAPVIGVSSPSSRVGRVGWKKVTKASGYEYQYSSSSRFTGAVTKTVGEAARSSNISLTSGRRYYFRVRAYRIVKGQKIYSDWSEAKSVKVK